MHYSFTLHWPHFPRHLDLWTFTERGVQIPISEEPIIKDSIHVQCTPYTEAPAEALRNSCDSEAEAKIRTIRDSKPITQDPGDK